MVPMRYKPAHSGAHRGSPLPMPLALATVLTSGATGVAYLQTRDAEASSTTADVRAQLAARTSQAKITSSRTAARARLAQPLTSGGVYRRIDPRRTPQIPAALTTVTSGDSRATAQARIRLERAVAAMAKTQQAYQAATAKATAASGTMTALQSELASRAPGARTVSASAVAVPAPIADLEHAEGTLAAARTAELRAADAHRAAIHDVTVARTRVEKALAADLVKLRAAQDARIAAGTMVRFSDGSVADAIPVGTRIPGNGHTLTAPVRGWIVQALEVLYKQGHPRASDDMMNLAIIIYNESGGDPGSKNLYDSNAAKGMPSFGLMQTIGPTFEAWALPDKKNTADPVHQIIAGARYAVAAYDSLANVPGVASLKSGGRYLPY